MNNYTEKIQFQLSGGRHESSLSGREVCIRVFVCVCARALVLRFNLPSSSPPVSLAVPARVALSSATNQRFSKQELCFPVSFLYHGLDSAIELAIKRAALKPHK